MIEINLLPDELRKRGAVRIVLPELPIKKTIYIAGGSILVFQFLATLLAVGLSTHNSILKNEISALTRSTQETVVLLKKSSEIQGRLREMELLTNRSFQWAKLLEALTLSMTKGVWLRELKMDEMTIEKAVTPPPASKEATAEKSGKPAKKAAPVERQQVRVMRLEGSVVAPGQETAYVGKFLKSLKENPVFLKLFKDIQLSNMSQRRVKDSEVYDFLIICTFNPEQLR